MSANGTFNLSQSGLYALVWAGVGISAVFVGARTAIRFQLVKKPSDFVADDYCVLVAWFLLLINAILQTLQAPHLYYLIAAANLEVPTGPALVVHGNMYVRYEFVIIGLFFTILWCIKAAFLSLYWRLFQDLRKWKIAWWVVVVFTFFAYVGDWVTSACTCHPAATYFKFGECAKPIDQRGSTISIAYSTTVDVLTDLLIIILPLSIIWNLRVTQRAKVGLVTVFSGGVIIIVIAIIRAVEINGKARADPVWLATWGIVESSVSVIVGCLPAFKSLFKLLRDRNNSSGQRRGQSYTVNENSTKRSSVKRTTFHQLETTESGTSASADIDTDQVTQQQQPGPISIHTEFWTSKEAALEPEVQADKLGLRNVLLRDSESS